MKSQYVAPGWATNSIKFIRGFFNSVRALLDVIWSLGDSIVGGVDHIVTKIFNAFGSRLNPIFASKVFIVTATCVVLWGLYSWAWMGVTLLGLFGMDPSLGALIGLALGVAFNIVEIVPEMGMLFQEYADVFARSGKKEDARKYDRWSITAKNFTDASLARLDSARNIACAAEFGISGWYSFVTNAFTKVIEVKAATAKTKAVTTIALKGFWPVVGTIMWCAALVKLPEISVKAAAAAIHVAAKLPQSAYTD